MANSYTFEQISTILNNIVADAQGRTASIATTPRTTADFVTMATTAISAGTDPIMHSLVQMINKTVFAYRPYSRKFRVLETDAVDFGNITRKVTPIFVDGAENQPMYDSQPADGNSTDQWTIKRPKTLQTVMVGADQYEVQAPTVFVDQLKTAFTTPEELSRFIAAQMGAVSNELEQQKESLARMTVANMIGAIINENRADRVVHLLTEYNAATGLSLTATTVFQPDNFPAFVKWAYARIESISEQMTERSTLFHSAITGYTIMRHTNRADQRLLVYAPALAQIKTMVLSGLYNDNLLSLGVTEAVNFWQNINSPAAINVKPRILNADGTTAVAGSAVAADNVFAVLYDRDAMGVNIFNEGAAATTVNAKGAYYNIFYHMAKRHWNDTTENGVVFLLD